MKKTVAIMAIVGFVLMSSMAMADLTCSDLVDRNSVPMGASLLTPQWLEHDYYNYCIDDVTLISNDCYDASRIIVYGTSCEYGCTTLYGLYSVCQDAPTTTTTTSTTTTSSITTTTHHKLYPIIAEAQ